MFKVITIIYVLHFFNDGVRFAFSSLLPFMAKDLHLTFTQVGILGAAIGILVLLLAIPTGIIVSKINGLKLLFLFLFAYSLFTFGIGVSSNFLLLFLFFYLASSVFAPFHIISQSTIARASTNKTVGVNMGNFSVVGDLGRVALPTVALFFAAFIGWRNAIFLLGILGLLVFTFYFLFLRNKKNIFHNKKSIVLEEGSKDWVKQMISMMRQKKLLLIMLGGFLDGIGGSSIFIYLPFLLLAKGITSSLLSLFVGGYFVGSLLGKWFLSKGINKYGSANIFISAEIFMAALMVIATISHDPFILFLISCILGLFTRGTAPVVSTLQASLSHEAHYEKVFAIGDIFLGTAAIISPILLGRTADIFGINTAFYLSAGFALLAAIPIYLYAKTTK